MGVVGLASAGVLAETFLIEPHWLEIVRRELPIQGLPKWWRGKTLAQISDIHVGPRVNDDYVIHSLQQVANLKADVVVYTGDFVSFHPGYRLHMEQLERVYRHLPRGTVATLGILGNHDYGKRWREPQKADQLTELLAGFGLRMLNNAVTDLDGLQFIGFEDLWSQRFDGAKAMAASDPRVARLVLCHNPDGADRQIWQGFQGWILSGHTHGGQCKPPFLPPPMLPVKNKRYVSGEVDLRDGRRLYISRGVGHILPVRFNVRPEVTLFTLV